MDRLVLWHRVFPPTRLEQDEPRRVAGWVRAVAERLRSAGAEPLATVGGSACVAFDLTELKEGIDAALRVMDDFEGSDLASLGASVGIATGEVVRTNEAAAGSAIDRAQLLACRARKGEVVVDQTTRELCESVFLFGRSVGAGAAALRGQTIDRRMPRRDRCRASIAALREAIVPPAMVHALEELREVTAEGRGHVLLRGPRGAGALRYIRELEATLAPPLVLRISGVPGALEPFGSLRLALLRHFGRPDDVEAALGETLAQVSRGVPVPPDMLRDAFRTRIASGAWLVLDPVPGIDPSSLALLAAFAERMPMVLLARVPLDAPLPQPLRALPWREVLLPSLRVEDAKEVARAVLGPDTDEDVIRRVAVLGGDTPLGVVEAARTLVAVGDLVHDEGRFAWRVSPRAGVRSIPTEDLLTERLASLGDAPRRLLEAIAMTPPGTPRLVVAAVAERDGLGTEVRREATARLRSEAWIADGPQLRPSSELLRRVLVHRMPPARAAELNRFVADALASSTLSVGPLVEATVGYYLTEGGDTEGGARALLRAAEAALEAGYRRAPRRLAAAAVQVHPLGSIRVEAGRIARAAQHAEGDQIERPSATPTAGDRVSELAVSALLAGDIDAVERTIEAAIAEGRDLAAADRVRAMAHLAKGDTEAAMKAFARLRRQSSGDLRGRARASLTLAWILLHTGDAEGAIRASLEALASARRLKDPRGEAAALHTMAACYRALGRQEEADRVADAAPV